LGENHPLGTQKGGPLARQKGPGAVFTILSGYALSWGDNSNTFLRKINSHVFFHVERIRLYRHAGTAVIPPSARPLQVSCFHTFRRKLPDALPNSGKEPG